MSGLDNTSQSLDLINSSDSGSTIDMSKKHNLLTFQVTSINLKTLLGLMQ